MDKNIRFVRTDHLPSYIEIFIKEYADHFKVPRNYLPEFSRMLRLSRTWRVPKMDNDIGDWREKFEKIRGTKTIIELVERSFKACTSTDDINRLRGGIVEALIIAKHGGSKILSSAGVGWGAKVILNRTEIVYECTEYKGKDCGDRKTVDLGLWNGHHAQFFECKANPILVGCKEIQYMKKLTSELSEVGVSHELFFVCPESQDAIQMRNLD